jgi:hypothetical protein
LDKIDYTKDKDKNIYMYPNLIAKSLQLPNPDVSGKCVLKIVNFDNTQSNALPILPTPGDFLNWYITPERHKAYSNFWLTATFMNLGTNLYIWIAL